MLAEVKAATGGLSLGLFAIAAIEMLAVLLIVWFVPKHHVAKHKTA